jgi:hypothetical protein
MSKRTERTSLVIDASDTAEELVLALHACITANEDFLEDYEGVPAELRDGVIVGGRLETVLHSASNIVKNLNMILDDTV